MKLLERFRAQPEWQSDDPAMRVSAVRELADAEQGLLGEIARHDDDPGVRRVAVERLTDAATIADLLAAGAEHDQDVIGAATTVARNLLIDASDGTSTDVVLAALTDERDVAAVARSATTEAVSRAAAERLTDAKALGAVARRARHVAVARAALERLVDRDELMAIALKADEKTVALAAYDRLVADHTAPARGMLEEIARRARHKAVSRRARARATLMAQAASEDTQSPPRVDEGTALCDAVDALRATSDLEVGRQEFDRVVQCWAALDAPVRPPVALRFAEGRRAIEDRLLALERAATQARQADARRAAAVAPLVSLCEHVEQLQGPLARDHVAEAMARWDKLMLADEVRSTVGVPDREALARRFVQARVACEQRHAAWVARHERVRQLETLIDEIEALVQTADIAAIKARWPGLDNAWTTLMADCAAETPAGDPEAAGVVAALGRRKTAAEDARRALSANVRADRLRQQQHNLAALDQLAAAVDAAVANETLRLGEAERQLRAARQALDKLPPLPTRHDSDAMRQRLRRGHSALLGRVRELRDFADWQRWANLGLQEELCREMEALATAPDDRKGLVDAQLSGRFRDLMDRWRQVADVPKDKGDALWRRFKQAHDAVYPRCQAYVDAQRTARAEGLARRQAIVAEAESLSASTDWIKTAQRLTALQAEWKALGPAPRKDQRALWNRFRTASGGFFTRRKADLAERKKLWTKNLEQKEALCARVEALGAVEDLGSATEEVRRAQDEWKTIGPVRRTRTEALWQRFRAASDAVFDRVQDGARAAAAEQIATREALCAELESLATGTAATGEEAQGTGPAPGALINAFRDLQNQWRRAPEVPPDIRRTLATRFGQATTKVVASHPEAFRGTDLDPARSLKQLEVLCTRAEALAPSATVDDSGASPSEILAKKWRAQLASNTMGSRADESARRRAAVEDVKRLMLERRKLGKVSGHDAQQLDERFQRACDKVFQQNQPKRPVR